MGKSMTKITVTIIITIALGLIALFLLFEAMVRLEQWLGTLP